MENDTRGTTVPPTDYFDAYAAQARSWQRGDCLQLPNVPWWTDRYRRALRHQAMVVTIMAVVRVASFRSSKINRMTMRRIEVRPLPRLLAHLHGLGRSHALCRNDLFQCRQELAVIGLFGVLVGTLR